MAQQETLSGTVEHIIFSSPQGSFSVLQVKGDGAPFTATVNAPPPLVGEIVELTGHWGEHKRFGQQFQAKTLRRIAPASEAGIERFLASGAVNGVGPALARRLVAAFGADTLEIIAKQPHRLSEVQGIGKKKMEKIHASYSEQSELRELMLFLETHGVSGAYAAKIYAQYASFAIDVLKENPYRLAREVDGIGFRTADQIAAGLGVASDSFDRLWAGIDFALLQASGAGHCCVPEQALAEQAAKLIRAEKEDVAAALKRLLREEKLYAEDVGNATLIYPAALYLAEKNIAAKLLFLKEHALSIDALAARERVRCWEERVGLALAESQRKAVLGALENGVFILTGGPGTGKTTVVRGIIEALEQQGLRLLLGAPTGRATKRLSETAGQRAQTVHRLLEAAPAGGGALTFERNAERPLEADVVIIDEASMMDLLLMHYLLEAVPQGCRVIFVGDADQLPAVGPGAVLNDMLRSQAIPAVRLHEVFRQTDNSRIVLNAHAINQGRMPECIADSDFIFREMSDQETVRAIAALCTDELPAQGFDSKNDVQVLSPMHRLECGVSHLNLILQDALNPEKPDKPELKAGGQTFRLGDKVMQMRNNYRKNVFNGDIGFISLLESERLVVEYPEGYVEYDAAELAELKLAYAMSVHKSQGSEYKVVILPLSDSHYIMLQRNLLYTAVTRAKEKVVLLGSKRALATAVANDRTKRRYTFLAERLNRQMETTW